MTPGIIGPPLLQYTVSCHLPSSLSQQCFKVCCLSLLPFAKLTDADADADAVYTLFRDMCVRPCMCMPVCTQVYAGRCVDPWSLSLDAFA